MHHQDIEAAREHITTLHEIEEISLFHGGSRSTEVVRWHQVGCNSGSGFIAPYFCDGMPMDDAISFLVQLPDLFKDRVPVVVIFVPIFTLLQSDDDLVSRASVTDLEEDSCGGLHGHVADMGQRHSQRLLKHGIGVDRKTA